jgi:hypothetical protein
MNLQLQRIQHACEVLKLPAMATEWSAMADHRIIRVRTKLTCPFGI